jgi:CSLREA domain-containing protein
MRVRLLVAVIAAICALNGPSVAPAPIAEGATTYAVTRTDDPPPDGCLPQDCSLREAIIAANADSDPGVVSLQAGTYELTTPGTYEDAALAGDLDS